MSVYLTIILLSLLLGVIFLGKEDTSRNRKAYLIAIFSILFFVSAFRAQSVGTDTQSMSLGAVVVDSRSWSIYDFLDQKAPLYYFLIFAFDHVLPPEQCYQIVSSLLVESCIAIFIYKNSKNCVLSTWLFLMQYLFFQSLNVGRQFMAISLVAVALCLIFRHRAKSALLVIAIATLIHSTAIIAVPMVALAKRMKSKRFYSVFLVLMAGGVLFYPQILDFFTAIFPRYNFYTVEGGIMYEAGQNRKIALTLFQFIYLVYAWGIYKKKKSLMPEHEKNVFQISMCLMAVSIAIGFAALSSLLLTRVEYYYTLAFMIMVPLCIHYSGKSGTLLALGTYAIIAIPGMVLLSSGSGGILPYSFCWQ